MTTPSGISLGTMNGDKIFFTSKQKVCHEFLPFISLRQALSSPFFSLSLYPSLPPALTCIFLRYDFTYFLFDFKICWNTCFEFWMKSKWKYEFYIWFVRNLDGKTIDMMKARKKRVFYPIKKLKYWIRHPWKGEIKQCNEQKRARNVESLKTKK